MQQAEKKGLVIKMVVLCRLCKTTEHATIDIGPHIGIGAGEFDRFRKLAVRKHKRAKPGCPVDIENPTGDLSVNIPESESVPVKVTVTGPV